MAGLWWTLTWVLEGSAHRENRISSSPEWTELSYTEVGSGMPRLGGGEWCSYGEWDSLVRGVVEKGWGE